MKVFLKLVIAFSILFFAGSCSTHSTRYNIVLIIADDLGYKDLSCYGSSFYETPNLDKLAGAGVRFTRGYASCCVCSPTRASIQTGKYPVQVGITDWIPGRSAYTDPSPTDRWLSAPLKNQLETKELTIADVLKANGYKTFFAGKWHLGETEEYWPERQGYDINKGGWKAGSPNKNNKLGYNGYFAPYGNPRLEDGPLNEYLPERLTTETCKFIEDNKDAPFFVCLSFYLVHIPLQALGDKIGKYEQKAMSLGLDTTEAFRTGQPWMKTATGKPENYRERILQSNTTYASMVEALDENVGRVINKLKEAGLEKNTLVIFTSDNGGLSTAEGSPTSILPLRGGKGWLYEGGIRVPYIIRFPDGKYAGTESEAPICSIDIFPTVLAENGISAPQGDDIAGVNMIPFIDSNRHPERALYWHYPHYSNQGGDPGSAIIEGNYKLIDNFETGRRELYDLAADAGENQDISGRFPEIADRLYRKLDEWRNQNSALMMKPNPQWIHDE